MSHVYYYYHYANTLWAESLTGGWGCYVSLICIMTESSKSSREEMDQDQRDFGSRKLFRLILQLFHLVLAAALFLVGVVEFSVEPSIFDVFGRKSEQRSVIPAEVFDVSL